MRNCPNLVTAICSWTTVVPDLMTNILQINLNHCRMAQNLLEQAVVEKKIDVVIACDPHEITDGVGGWLTSERSNQGIQQQHQAS